VILLWLLNLKDARQRAAKAGETDQVVVALRGERDRLRADLDDLTRMASALFAELDDSARRLADARSRLQAAEERERAALAARDKANTRIAVLTNESDMARQELEQQKKLRLDLERRLQVGGHQADDMTRKLAEANRRIKDLLATAELVPALRDELRTFRDKLSAEETAARALRLEIDKRKKAETDEARMLDTLRGTSARLEKELADTQRRAVAAENRFAGIALTGKRVVFLVDMSGSMDLVDAETPAPSKWQGVRDTVARIMKSLPELEKFQVILFAEKAAYPLGDDGRWIDYDPKTSVDRVTKTLAATKPEGGTNMYAALDAAFRLRGSGLDTIYLLSDGLPNMGEGLTEQQAQTLKETDKAEILGKYIRKKLKEVWNRPIDGYARVRINAVGFFYESPDVGAFLWALARENDGSFVGMSKP
jgi:hypothetical protein